MTQAPVRLSFEEYLSMPPGALGDQRHLWIDGELHPMSPESMRNRQIAKRIFAIAVMSGANPDLIDAGGCELVCPEVPGMPRNRYPDLVILRPEHLSIGTGSNTITMDMAPPQLVVEVLSPRAKKQKRDLVAKRYQYALRGIPEYWIIDPDNRRVLVLKLNSKGQYKEVPCGNELRAMSFISIPLEALWR